MNPRYAPVLADIREGLTSWDIWGRLGWRETRLRYQRTVIGPFWTTLSLGVFVIVMGILWSQLWKTDPKIYMPFLTSGMITWLLLTTTTLEGCGTFTGQEPLIKQLKTSCTLLACSIVWRNLIVFAHNVIIYVFVCFYGNVPVTWATLLVIPGLILLCLNLLWICLVMGLICVRYRDIQQLTTLLLQISMFLTPIFWSPDQLQGRSTILIHYNILYHYLEIVRGPLLGRAPEAWSWIMVGTATVVGWALMLFMYGRFRRRISYWL